MATVEFLAFPGYVRKVIRHDEADDSDHPVPGTGLRCRLWSKQPPSAGDWRKGQTYLLDLAAHPGADPDFTSDDVDTLQCDAPGLTRIGDGDGVNNGPFDLSDDYVNRVYLAKPFWNTLDPAVQPVFPPLTPFVDIPERQLSPSPQAYECKTIIYSNDDPDPPRRRHRYIGRYAEMVSLVGGAVWTVDVFMWGSGLKRSITLDFSNLASYAGATEIGPTAAQFGALYLDYHIFTANHFDLPKLPASQIDGIAFGEPAPTVATIAALVSGRGQW